jgi:hypothetical protein
MLSKMDDEIYDTIILYDQMAQYLNEEHDENKWYELMQLEIILSL